MLTKRKVATLVTTLAMAGSGVALGAAPASAAPITSTTTTTLVLDPAHASGNPGDALSPWMSSETVASPDSEGDTEVWAGVAYLQMRENGSDVWTTIATDDSPGYQYFPDINFTTNAYYRVYYQGGFYDGYPDDVTYTDSVSNEVYVAALRNITIKDISKGDSKYTGVKQTFTASRY